MVLCINLKWRRVLRAAFYTSRQKRNLNRGQKYYSMSDISGDCIFCFGHLYNNVRLSCDIGRLLKNVLHSFERRHFQPDMMDDVWLKYFFNTKCNLLGIRKIIYRGRSTHSNTICTYVKMYTDIFIPCPMSTYENIRNSEYIFTYISQV